MSEESIDRRLIDRRPQPMRGRGRDRQAVGAVRRLRSERGDVLADLEVLAVAEGGAHSGNGLADSCSRPNERSDIEGDAQWVHRHGGGYSLLPQPCSNP
jgi:hypothetical protein